MYCKLRDESKELDDPACNYALCDCGYPENKPRLWGVITSCWACDYLQQWEHFNRVYEVYNRFRWRVTYKWWDLLNRFDK